MAGPHVNLVEIESDRENSFLATHARSLPGGNTLIISCHTACNCALNMHNYPSVCLFSVRLGKYMKKDISPTFKNISEAFKTL